MQKAYPSHRFPCYGLRRLRLTRFNFPSAPSVAIAREKFNSRRQSDFESVIEYFSDLSLLASKCDYGTLQDELICDKLILGARDSIKEKLILEQPKSLKSALETARRIEIIQGELNSRSSSDRHSYSDTPTVNKLCISESKPVRSRENAQQRKLQNNDNFRKSHSRPSKSDPYCFRCGSYEHMANHSKCPAINKTCNKCHKKGHYSRVCFRTQTFQDGDQILNLNSSPQDQGRFRSILTHKNDSSSNTEYAKITYVIDTGSCATILPKSIFCKYFPFTELQQCTETIRDY